MLSNSIILWLTEILLTSQLDSSDPIHIISKLHISRKSFFCTFNKKIVQLEKPLFDEKQYMGHNRLSIIWRTLITLFCFIGYYWSENPKPVQVAVFRIGYYPALDIPNSGKIFFLLGVFMLILSTTLVYVLHTRIKVFSTYLVIDGFWTARRVKINLDTITHIRKSKYKKNIFRRAVYNLHSRGIIRFFTSGNEFIELKDNAGFTYRIGSQKTPELFQTLKKQIKELQANN